MQKVEPLDILYYLLVTEILTSEMLGYLDTFLPPIRDVSRIFLMRFPSVRNYRIIFGVSSDQLLTI